MHEDDDLFIQEFLSANNYYRRMHSVPELELSVDLTEKAQQWAEKLAQSRHLSYSELPGIGENITFFPAQMSASDIVEYWYKEEQKYDYSTPSWQLGTNYFTQLVWKGTKEIGIGYALVEEKTLKNEKLVEDPLSDHQVVVALYRPTGNNNLAGQFAANINPPMDSSP